MYDSENKQLLREYCITKDSELLEDLYFLNQGLFYKIVSKYTGLCEKEDLLQECFFALLKAVNSYRPESGEFGAFLAVVVSNHLQQYVNSNRTITAPEYIQILAYKYQELKNRGYSEKRILATLEITHEQIVNIKRFLLILNVKSLDKPIKADSEIILSDIVPDPMEYQERIIDNIFHEEISSAIDRAELSEREKEFIYKRFYKNMTYREIDPEHAENNTRNIIERGLRKLRKNDSLRRLFAETNIYICNGLSYFKANHTSGVERVILHFNNNK